MPPITDAIYGMVEGLLRGLILNIAAFVGDAINGVFNADSTGWDGQPTSVDLEASVEMGNVVLALALPLTIAAVIWQIMRSTAAGRVQGVVRAIVGGVAMVATTRILFWYGPEAIPGFDQVTVELLNAVEAGPGGLGATLMAGVGLIRGTDGEWQAVDGGDWKPPPWMVFGAMGGNPLGIPAILWVLLGLATLALMMMLAFRRWALVAMVALVPLALMFLPAEKASKAIVGTWIKVFVSLLAAKPLAALILSISAKMLAAATQMNLIMFIAAMIGMAAAALAPWIAMRFVNFLGVEISQTYTRAAGDGALRSGAQSASRAASSLSSIARTLGVGNNPPRPVTRKSGTTGSPAAVSNATSGRPTTHAHPPTSSTSASSQANAQVMRPSTGSTPSPSPERPPAPTPTAPAPSAPHQAPPPPTLPRKIR